VTLHCRVEKIELSGSGHEYLDSLTKWSLPPELDRPLLWFAVSYLKSPELHCSNHLNCSLSYMFWIPYVLLGFKRQTNSVFLLSRRSKRKFTGWE